MSQVVTSPDFVSIATNAGVFLAAVGTVIAAIWSAVKKIKSVETGTDAKTANKVLGGMILDTTTILMWQESNRDVVEALRDHQKEVMELRFAVVQLKDTMR